MNGWRARQKLGLYVGKKSRRSKRDSNQAIESKSSQTWQIEAPQEIWEDISYKKEHLL